MKFLTVILALVLAACSDNDPAKGAEKKKKPVPPPSISESRLEEFTGARTKIVWTQVQNVDKVDKQGTSRYHFLYALDSSDGRGARKVLEARANYAYPIITPDGKQIVFTRKEKITKGDKRTFKPSVEIVNFDGSGLRKLGRGYAQEVWEDPETGKYWIYAGDQFVLAGGTAPICKRIIRFPLDDPSKVETVWNRTKMGTDSFAISADGKRFAGLFPWPKAGIGDLVANDWEPLTNGCWVAMAPDNSYSSWVFDGAHKNFLMFDADANPTATIPVNTHPDLKGKEVYHPRWGNQRQFFVLSGPHRSGKKKGRGKPVEIFLGRFSPELDRVESWFKVTKNGLPDIYPDVWVEPGGAQPSIAKSNTPDPGKVKKARWPSDPEGLVFKWENVQAKNEFTAPDGSNQVSKTAPKGFARYGPNYEMNLDGGSFEPVLDSEAWVKSLSTKKEVYFQCLLSAKGEGGHLFDTGEIALRLQAELDDQAYAKLHLNLGRGRFCESARFSIEEPTHICVNYSGGMTGTAYVNGQKIDFKFAKHVAISKLQDTFQFGSGLDGTLENIAFYERPISAEEAAADYALIKAKLDKRKPIERLRVKGKLLTTSPLPTLEAIKPYVRALVYQVYETDDPKLKTIAVTHWAILDKEPIAGLPREIGKTYDLTIESRFAHPELNSQAESNDEEKISPTLMLYHDVTTPNK